MSTVVGLLALALLPVYIARMAALDRRRDPAWEMGGTYAGFVCAVVSGGAWIRFDVEPMHTALVIVSVLWLVFTMPHWAERSLADAG